MFVKDQEEVEDLIWLFGVLALLQLKPWSARGASHHPAFMGNFYSHIFSFINSVDEFSFNEMRTWGQFKISPGSLCVWCESKPLGGRMSAKSLAPRKPLCRFFSSYGKLFGRAALRILSNINDRAPLQTYVECSPLDD